jgi:hypothetical protein
MFQMQEHVQPGLPTLRALRVGPGVAGDNCSARRHGYECNNGMRKHSMHLVCGAVLPVWCAMCCTFSALDGAALALVF